MQKMFLGCLALLGMVNALCGTVEIETVYGSCTVSQAVIEELLASPAMQRLKEINQYGINEFIKPEHYTRYEHSIGVFFLLRHYGASVEEQIDGLLHDASHTIFSHVGDHLVNGGEKGVAYQDSIHEWYLKESGLQEILQKHGYGRACTDAQKKKHRLLERPLPYVCADRLEYNLKGGLLEGLLTKEDITFILKHLEYHDNEWIFTNKQTASLFANTTLHLTEHIWGAPWNQFIYTIAGTMLLRALEIELFTWHDIHFSTDALSWERLQQSNDRYISWCVQQIINYKDAYQITDVDDYDIYVRGKFRGVDPLIRCNDSLCLLSQCDETFAYEYQRVKQVVQQGYYLKCKNQFSHND